jgi:hypothetical protein
MVIINEAPAEACDGLHTRADRGSKFERKQCSGSCVHLLDRRVQLLQCTQSQLP